MKLPDSKIVLFTVFAIMLISSIWYHLNYWPEHINVLSWDVYGYYLYLPGIFNFHDVDTYSFTTLHLEKYKIAFNKVYQLSQLNDEYIPTYTLGMALLYLPFFLIGDVFAYLIPRFPQDGLSAPYQWSIIIGSWAYAFLGLVYLRKILLKLDIRDSVISIVIIAIGLGSNYFHYACFENGMPHSWLFTLYIFLLYIIIKWHESPTLNYSLSIGIIAALLALARPSEGILIILFLLYGFGHRFNLKQKLSYFLDHWKPILVIILVGLFIVGIQIIFWYKTAGILYFNSYDAHGHVFDFQSPHIYDGLFSYRKGWLIYTPIMVLSILGFFTKHKYEELWWPILLFVLVNTYIVLSWHIWWYANSFGMRALIQSYGLLAIPLASLIDKYWENSLVKNLVIGIVAFAILLNQYQDWQYRNKILPGDNITKTFYWKSINKITLDKDLRKYMDTNENAPSSLMQQTIIARDTVSSEDGILTCMDKSFSHSVTYNIDAHLTKNDWIMVSADLFTQTEKFGLYDQAKLVTSTIHKGKSLKWKGVKVQQIIPLSRWYTMSYTYQIPQEASISDEVKLVLWNKSPDSIYVKNLSISLLK